MTLTWLLALIATLFVVGTLLNIVLVRYLALLWRAPEATWRRATRVVLIIAAANGIGYAITITLFFAERWWRILSEGMLEPAAIIISIFISLVVPLWAFATGFKVSLGKALGIFGSLMLASTLVAYGMAFALRATLAEAFVVPTGAMAPTVLGQHLRVRCPNCGSEFEVGASAGTIDMLGWRSIADRGHDCLQCGTPRIQFESDELHSGDRLLVDKTSRRPQRLDLVVFRVMPDEHLNYGAQLGPQNWVKRCVGLPGEEVAIVDGDLFIDGQRLQKGPNAWGDLWFPVHDTALAPRRPVENGSDWHSSNAKTAWQRVGGKWQVNDKAPITAQLSFVGDMTDRYAYNLPDDSGWSAPVAVRDWRITVDLEDFSGKGALGFFWQQGEKSTCLAVTPQGAVQTFDRVEQFVADQEATPGAAAPTRKTVQRMTFAVRDGKAYLMIDDQPAATVELEPSDLLVARSMNDEAAVRLGMVAREVNVTLSRIQLHRDVYYRTQRQMALDAFGHQDDEWRLDREYFFLGDNSPQSQDSRFIGPIHEAEIVGVARWCYWPLERAREFPSN